MEFSANRSRIEVLMIGTIFGVIIFIYKSFLPTPFDKMIIIIQALLLALSSLLLGRLGATYVGTVGGLLTTAWRVSFAPFSLIFAVLYGILVDIFLEVFRVRLPNGEVKQHRLTVSLTLSTALVALLSTYMMVSMGLISMPPFLYPIIIAVGILNGIAASYLASSIWKKYLIRYARSLA